jgi:hypothetical protein
MNPSNDPSIPVPVTKLAAKLKAEVDEVEAK